jgi:hypothetical protein
MCVILVVFFKHILCCFDMLPDSRQPTPEHIFLFVITFGFASLHTTSNSSRGIFHSSATFVEVQLSVFGQWDL